MRTDRRHLALTPTERDRFERLRAQLEEHDLPLARSELEVLRPYAAEDSRYYKADEALQWLQQRIECLCDALTVGVVADEAEALSAQYARLGSKITVRSPDGADRAYTIVLSVHEGRGLSSDDVSYRAPIGQALLGAETGDSILVEVPNGPLLLDVVSVEQS